MRGTALLGEIFAAHVVSGVGCERHSGIAALLRAVVHQPVLTDVKVACPGAAAPFVRQALRNVVLESVDPGEAALLPRLHFVINAALFVVEWLHLSAAVVNNADGRA